VTAAVVLLSPPSSSSHVPLQPVGESPGLIAGVLDGVTFKDGIKVEKPDYEIEIAKVAA